MQMNSGFCEVQFSGNHDVVHSSYCLHFVKNIGKLCGCLVLRPVVCDVPYKCKQ